MKPVTALGLVLVNIVLYVVTGCRGDVPEATHTAERVSVRIDTVRIVRTPSLLSAVGTTEAYTQASPGTRLAGRVVETPVTEGDRVANNAVLARIDNADLRARESQVVSSLDAARSTLTLAEVTTQRIRNLYQEHAIPKQTLDDAEAQYARARAQHAQAEGMLREIQTNLSYGTVTAPFAGIITQKFVQPGDMGTPGMPLFTLEQLHPIKITADVSEQDINQIRVGMIAHVRIDAVGTASAPGEQTVREGRVTAVIPAADPKTRTFRVKIEMPNEDGAIRSGMFARVEFPGSVYARIVVPVASIVRQGGLEGVFVIENTIARLRWIRLGKRDGQWVDVVSGLEPGTVVAVSGTDRLRDGVGVTIPR